LQFGEIKYWCTDLSVILLICSEKFPPNCGRNDDEIFGNVDIVKLDDMIYKEVYHVNDSQKKKIEEKILLYLIAKDMWNSIYALATNECMACTNPETMDNLHHSCTLLHCLYFVTTPNWLKILVAQHYETAQQNMNWDLLEVNCHAVKFQHSLMKQCSSTYWRTRARQDLFRKATEPYIYEIARQGGYFYTITEIINVIGFNLPKLFINEIHK
jgi:hypothetical protein